MKTEERQQWISTLNIGDEIAYRTGMGYRFWVITKISKITPSKRFNLTNGTVINQDGSIRGDKYFYIHPVTDEIRMSIWRDRAVSKIRTNFKIDKLSNGQLKVLLEMISE